MAYLKYSTYLVIFQLTVHSPGRKYAQAQLANVFTTFVEGLERGKNGVGSGNSGAISSSRWAEPIQRIFKNTKIESRNFLWDPKGIEKTYKAEEVMPNLIKENTKIASETISLTTIISKEK